jgi:hypothetical protein
MVLLQSDEGTTLTCDDSVLIIMLWGTSHIEHIS